MITPVIGLTTYNDENKRGHPIAALTYKYILAITDAGAAPVLIPSGVSNKMAESLIRRLDGILFTGGGDIAVERFNGEYHPCIEAVDTSRDAVEFDLLHSAVEFGKPFLGICRGFQVVNVAMGGTLFTDIQDQFPGALKHDYDSGRQREFLAHEVRVVEGSRLVDILGESRIQVNSLHHQGAKDLAASLRPVAFAPDDLVEAVELPDHPFGIAVQWHPEWLTNQSSMRRLFAAFVEAARKA